MADAFHAQSMPDGHKVSTEQDNEPKSAAGATRGLVASESEDLSTRYLQPPTLSFTPATPSPPPSLSHDGLDDSLIEGFLSNDANSLNSTALSKITTLDSGSLEFSGELDSASLPFADNAQNTVRATDFIENDSSIVGLSEKEPAVTSDSNQILQDKLDVSQDNSSFDLNVEKVNNATSDSTFKPSEASSNELSSSKNTVGAENQLENVPEDNNLDSKPDETQAATSLKENSHLLTKNSEEIGASTSSGHLRDGLNDNLVAENIINNCSSDFLNACNSSDTSLSETPSQEDVSSKHTAQNKSLEMDVPEKLTESLESNSNSGIVNDKTSSLQIMHRDSSLMEVDEENSAISSCGKVDVIVSVCQEAQSSNEKNFTKQIGADVEKAVPDPLELSSACKDDDMLLSDSGPLQPVTIGGSLQPLEEMQEESLLNDPSFTADLSLMDSSADEAESIGGLVINSVIGAAEGVADFPPDDEKQLTDISASAPCMIQENCDVESGEDSEPAAKRMRMENGESGLEDKLSDAKRVLFKVVPVKNGHGIWDSVKFNQVLLSKGTILLRIHASGDELENGSLEKCDIEVDFTCIMVSAKEENELILGLSTQDPDADMCDPLAIGASTTEENSPTHFSQPFHPTNRGQSTALQPAIQRPGYRQLQSPTHVFSKNEVLGLPQPLEFEEPQSGTGDWAGKEYYAGLLLQRKKAAAPPSSHHFPGSPAQQLPARGRKRGRPPLTGRRGFSPTGGSPRSSPSKAKSQAKNLPEPIKFRPPTPPQHLLISSLLKLNKSPNGSNKVDGKKIKSRGDIIKVEHSGFGYKSKKQEILDQNDDEEEIVTVSQPHFTNLEDSNDTDSSSIKRFLIKLSCDFCDLVFRKRASLNAHIRHTHRGVKKCPICNANVKTKGKYGMRFHILKAHKDHPSFHCEKCGESFKLKHHLINHERLRHELMDSDDEEQRRIIEEQERELDRKIRAEIEEEKKFEREKLEKESAEKEWIEKENKESELSETASELCVTTEQIQVSSKLSSDISDDGNPKQAPSESVQGKSIASRVVNSENANAKPVSRGKVMNVRPPGRPPKSQAKNKVLSPAKRVTRSSSKTDQECEHAASDSDTDSSGGDDSSVSSSETEVAEKKGHVCDICGKNFTHVFKLKHHKKSEHSKPSESKPSVIVSGQNDTLLLAKDDKEENDDEDDSDEDEEEDELLREKVKKEKQRHEKEVSLTCGTCNKVCRSEYQLKLHLPIHTLVRKKRGRKPLLAGRETTKIIKEECVDESPRKPSVRESSRVLRSTPHTSNESKIKMRSSSKQITFKENSVKVTRKENQEVKSKTSSELFDSDDRPSYVLKVGSLFRCTKCNVTFNREKSMTYHLKKIHETLYPFRACEHCGRVFRSCGPYNRHILQHKVHHCPETNCKAKFRKMLRLKQHQKNAHPNKSFRCSKCVALFSKQGELDKHYNTRHPRPPSGDEDENSEEEGEEEEKKGYSEKNSCEGKDETEDQKEVKKEKLVSHVDMSPSKRKARCVPISYKEPEDEEDLVPSSQGSLLKQPRDTRNSRERSKIVSEGPKNLEKRNSDIQSGLTNRVTAETQRRKRLNPNVERKNLCDYPRKIHKSSLTKTIMKKQMICLRSEIDARIRVKSNKELPPRKNFKLLDKSRMNRKGMGKSSNASGKIKKSKIKLSWTAALKAQIRAAERKAKEASSKSPPKKKKKPPAEKNKSATTKSKKKANLASSTANVAFGHDFMQHHDALPYPSYLVGDDSMFSLDDSSQMDIIGDYYGSQYPPSEEISDFVPDDDESGPGKIIGFDSF